MADFDIFDFIVNEDDELMLLIYQQDSEPKDSHIDLSREDHSAVLYRNETDTIVLNDLDGEIFDSIAEADTLLVCELTREEKEEDTQIAYAYEAEVRF